MLEVVNITKALADENRLRILAMLQPGELCVCQVIALLGLAPSTVSKHLYILKQARLIDSRKEGRWMHYRLAGPTASKPVRDALKWLRESLADDPHIARDAKRLKSIVKIDPQELCCIQRDGCCDPKLSKLVNA